MGGGRTAEEAPRCCAGSRRLTSWIGSRYNKPKTDSYPYTKMTNNHTLDRLCQDESLSDGDGDDDEQQPQKLVLIDPRKEKESREGRIETSSASNSRKSSSAVRKGSQSQKLELIDPRAAKDKTTETTSDGEGAGQLGLQLRPERLVIRFRVTNVNELAYKQVCLRVRVCLWAGGSCWPLFFCHARTHTHTRAGSRVEREIRPHVHATGHSFALVCTCAFLHSSNDDTNALTHAPLPNAH